MSRIPAQRGNLIKLTFSYKMFCFTLLYIFQRRGEWKKLVQLQPTAVSRVDIACCSSLSKTNISCLCWVNYSEKQNQRSHLFLSKDHMCICGGFLVSQKAEERSGGTLSTRSVAGTAVTLWQCDHCVTLQCWTQLMRGWGAGQLRWKQLLTLFHYETASLKKEGAADGEVFSCHSKLCCNRDPVPSRLGLPDSWAHSAAWLTERKTGVPWKHLIWL